MAYYVASISKKASENWDKCKEHGVFGIPTYKKYLDGVKSGDEFLLWLGGRGFVARCRITSEFYLEDSEQERIWEKDYPYRVRFEVIEEYDPPRSFGFKDNVMLETSIPAGALRGGFCPISEAQFLASIQKKEPDKEGRVAETTHEDTGHVCAPHSVAEFNLLSIGSRLGCSLWIAPGDKGRVKGICGCPQVLDELPNIGFIGDGLKIISQIDVLWLKSDQVVAAFEVEHTTPIFSGLLRLADLVALYPHLNIPLFVVAPDDRKDRVIWEINRPVFSKMTPPLAHKCRYIPYGSLEESLRIAEKYSRALIISEFLKQISIDARIP